LAKAKFGSPVGTTETDAPISLGDSHSANVGPEGSHGGLVDDVLLLTMDVISGSN
jgi:hypothetical protein